MRFAESEDEVEEIRKRAARTRSRRGDQEDGREITLGAGSMLGIFFSLVLICGLFFGLGYSVGRGGATPVVTQPAETPGAPVASNQGKPSPDQLTVAQSPDAALNPAANSATPVAGGTTAATAAPGQTPAQTATPASPQSASPAMAQTTSSASAQMTTPSAAAQPASASPASTTAFNPVPLQRNAPSIQPASAPAGQQPLSTITPLTGTYMVQIAAVRMQQDANVLVTALENRGYKVTIRREQDNLLHVQVGPFMTRTQAMAMRSRLLADGYNAIVKP